MEYRDSVVPYYPGTTSLEDLTKDSELSYNLLIHRKFHTSPAQIFHAAITITYFRCKQQCETADVQETKIYRENYSVLLYITKHLLLYTDDIVLLETLQVYKFMNMNSVNLEYLNAI